jgi:hypothetical protein
MKPEPTRTPTPTAIADALTAATARLWAKEQVEIARRFRPKKRRKCRRRRIGTI